MEITFQITEEELKNIVLGSEGFKEIVANKVVGNMKDYNDEIKSEYLNIFREQTRKIVDEYLIEYYSGRAIRSQVEASVQSLTRKEVLDLLSKKEDLF